MSSFSEISKWKGDNLTTKLIISNHYVKPDIGYLPFISCIYCIIFTCLTICFFSCLLEHITMV